MLRSAREAAASMERNNLCVMPIFTSLFYIALPVIFHYRCAPGTFPFFFHNSAIFGCYDAFMRDTASWIGREINGKGDDDMHLCDRRLTGTASAHACSPVAVSALDDRPPPGTLNAVRRKAG